MVTITARRRALALAGLVGVLLLTGCAASSGGSADGVGASRLRNDLGVSATVAICADAACAHLPSTVKNRLEPGASLPVNVAVDVDQYYIVEVAGAPARCLRVPAHPDSSEPTVALSAAIACVPPVRAGSAETAARSAYGVLKWLALVPLFAASCALWWIIGIVTRDAYRFIRRRSAGRIGSVAAVALCAAALLLGGWLLALPYWVGKQLRQVITKWRQSRPV